MKNVFIKTVMGAGLTTMLLVSCVDGIKDLYDPNYVIQQYQKNWTDSIGQIDPSQTWNTAKRIVADFDLRSIVSGECQVNIYTANPLTPSTKLLASAKISSYGAIEFDMPRALNYVYVSVQNASVLNGYYSIQEGLVAVSTHATRADESVASLGNLIEMGEIQNPLNGWQSEIYPGDFYYLANVSKTVSSQWRYLDYQPLFGRGGYFAEGTNNYELYGEKWDVDKDIVYTTAEDGPVEVSYSFGATRSQNMFGYFYFKNGASIEEILNSPKYILMLDAKPTSNLKVTDLSNNFSFVDDMQLGDWLKNNMLPDGSFQGGDPFVIGTTYQLTYFGEDGKSAGTANFPAGINIGFFVITDGMITTEDQLKYKIWYSMPSLNYRTAKVYNVNGTYEPDVVAVSYKYGDTNILGFEDNTYGDKDMNDIVFFVAGDFEEDYTPEQAFPVVPPAVEAQEWILACEDLGNTDDFDFNDVVFSVKYVAGSPTAFITPLAAGGTLPANICYNGQLVGQEVHEWFGVSTSTMVNTTNRCGHVAKTIELDVADGFTMTSNMGGFTIDVNNGTTTVAAPVAGAAPQMILVSDANWAWPYERVSIVSAYSRFKDWSENASSNVDWYATPTGKNVDGDYSNSSPEEGADDTIGDEDDDTMGDEGADDTVTPEGTIDITKYVGDQSGLHDAQKIPGELFGVKGAVITIETNGAVYGNGVYACYSSNWTAVASMADNKCITGAGTYAFEITAEECVAIKSNGWLWVTFNGYSSVVTKMTLTNK